MTQVVNHKGKRLKVGPRGGVTIYIYIYLSSYHVLGLEFNSLQGLRVISRCGRESRAVEEQRGVEEGLPLTVSRPSTALHCAPPSPETINLLSWPYKFQQAQLFQGPTGLTWQADFGRTASFQLLPEQTQITRWPRTVLRTLAAHVGT